jgi:hypothetical protein
MIDAREAMRAREQSRRQDLDPGAVVVIFRGSPNAVSELDGHRIFDALNWALAKHPDMTLATCGAPGAERLALSWARQKKVRMILARPDFDGHKGAAPFKANDQLLQFEPQLALTLADSLDPTFQTKPSGVVLNLGQKAEAEGVRHMRIRARG